MNKPDLTTPESPAEQDIKISVGFSSELFDQARQAARLGGSSLDQFAADAIRERLDRLQPPPQKPPQAQDTRRIPYQLPEPKVRPSRLKLTIEVDADLAIWFKTFCGTNGYQQRDLIDTFLKALREQHDK